jgi:nitrilase
LQHIALEGRCFVLGCNQYVTKSMYPADLEGIEDLDSQPEELCRGGSVIISPLGQTLAGPLYGAEGILYADVQRSAIAEGKFDFDVIGHYARNDIFSFAVNEAPQTRTTDIGEAMPVAAARENAPLSIH